MPAPFDLHSTQRTITETLKGQLEAQGSLDCMYVYRCVHLSTEKAG